MNHRPTRPSRRRRESPRTAPRMTLLPDPAPADVRLMTRELALSVDERPLGPYEARYDIALGYGTDRYIVVP